MFLLVGNSFLVQHADLITARYIHLSAGFNLYAFNL
jgi:hypothetical protein